VVGARPSIAAPTMSHSIETSSTTLELPGELRERLEQWARLRYPLEACGLLLGRRVERRTEVMEVCEGRNLDATRARDRYELDPADQVAAEDAARARGLDVVGVWHSHPDHPARPSSTDRMHAWSGWSYVIVAVDVHAAYELRAWRLERQRFVEEEVLP